MGPKLGIGGGGPIHVLAVIPGAARGPKPFGAVIGIGALGCMTYMTYEDYALCKCVICVPLKDICTEHIYQYSMDDV